MLDADTEAAARRWQALKVLTASLFTCGQIKIREIYIHSKLMVFDDSMFTIGSAHLNLRSMRVDREINLACDNPDLIPFPNHPCRCCLA